MNRHIFSSWPASSFGQSPMPLWFIISIFPAIVIWTLPQTLIGLFIALYYRIQGHSIYLYLFGPFMFVVVPTTSPTSRSIRGISLGVVVFSDHYIILKHEFCHLLSGMWLSWFYLPVYGIEYRIVGHSRSPHERLTNWFEKHLNWGWKVV